MRYIIFLGLVMAGLFQVFFWLIQDNQISIIQNSYESIDSLSYTPYKSSDRKKLSDKEIEEDINMLSFFTKKLRTYSSYDAARILKVISKIDNMSIDLGIWLSANYEDNFKEIELAIELSKKYPKSINSIIVGNETLLRKDLNSIELIGYLNFVSEHVPNKITTGEVWKTWDDYPDLSNNVDFIMVHILPYWEEISIEDFNDYILEKFFYIGGKFSPKQVVIGETGWPSNGYNNKDAQPNLKNQATAIRSFLNIAKANNISYNIVEAIDQPWKGYKEGNVGQYWGIFDENRKLKFYINGDIEINEYWLYQMIAAILIGAFLTLFGLKNQRLNINHSFAYAVTAQGMAFGIVMAIVYPFNNYMNFGMWVMWGMGTFLMIPLVIITLAKANELFRNTIGKAPKRLIKCDLKSENTPFVSIHVPAYKEQPDVLAETIIALSKLKYPNYEVLVIINNSPEEFYWKSIEKLCKELGEKFVFLNITCTGFKAGALNKALEYTNKKTEIIAVIDADYKVESPWLTDLVPVFDDPKVAIVQAPQDHRDGEESIIKTAMNAEYAGFFDIGMIDRNEENAIVVHGTMVLVRLNAMIEVGGWGTDTIVEDSELGLRLFEAGYTAHYTNRRYGYGLLPDTIEAFKTQRHRWAYGAIQILKKHYKEFLPSSKKLTPRQKKKFIAGWFFWLSDAMGPIMAVMNIIWVPVIIFVGVTIPTIPLTIPIITAFLVNILHTFILYRTNVKISLNKTILSSIASMSLQLIIFKAVFDGFIKDGLPFKRTEKGGGKIKKVNNNPIKGEIILAILLLTSFFALIITNESRILEIYVFAITILIQSIPYLSAIFMRWLELKSIKENKA
ncbi:MAG: glycosyl transferase [Arcobacter sp.]|nr:MAG: glycosyl transferase [Arcobacter sp.]